jgi:redox-sensitive bicupin YhaK (pirin superfamily)
VSYTPAPGPVERAAPGRSVIAPRLRDLGGFSVRRVLPAPKHRMVGPFIFFDHMGPADFDPGGGIDVRPHPHINLATVTYLFEGEIFHRDSLGSAQAIRPGAINWMTAGQGIVHSERTPPEVREAGHRLHGLQIWVALPRAAEEVAPSFHHPPADSLPVFSDAGVEVRVLVGSAFGVTSPVAIASPLSYVEAALAPGAVLPLAPAFPERAVYLVEGAVEIGGTHFDAGQMILLAPGDRELRAGGACRLVVIAGEPLDEPRFIEWNFVSSSRERIEEAKRAWGERRFPLVPGDDKEFIPLPE